MKMESMLVGTCALVAAVPNPAPPICVEPFPPPVKPVVGEPLKLSHQSHRISKFSVILKPVGDTLEAGRKDLYRRVQISLQFQSVG